VRGQGGKLGIERTFKEIGRKGGDARAGGGVGVGLPTEEIRMSGESA